MTEKITKTITKEALDAFLDQEIKARKEAQKDVVYPPVRYLSGGEIKIKSSYRKSERPAPSDYWSPEKN